MSRPNYLQAVKKRIEAAPNGFVFVAADFADVAENQRISDCLYRLEKEKIICGYHTLIDWEKTNVDKVTALIEVRIAPQRGDGFDRIAERIYQYEEVESLYLMSGDYDLAVTITGRSLRAVAEFVHARLAVIDGVTGTATHFILKKYKEKHHLYTKLPEQEERVLFV